MTHEDAHEMDPDFRDIFAGLTQASEALSHMIRGLERAATGAEHAHREHGDLRESVARLEHLVIAQGTDLRALRAEVQQLRERLDGNGRK